MNEIYHTPKKYLDSRWSWNACLTCQL